MNVDAKMEIRVSSGHADAGAKGGGEIAQAAVAGDGPLHCASNALCRQTYEKVEKE